MEKDLLYHLLEQHLSAPADVVNSHDALVKTVATAYYRHLLSLGHVPYLMIQVVIEDLEVEVLEMYRKKTYGSYSLSSYRQDSRQKRKN